MGYSVPHGPGIVNAYGMSNDEYGHYGGGNGTWPRYVPTSAGKIFPHSNDASLTTRNMATNRSNANVTGNSTSWYMWGGSSGSPSPYTPGVANHTNRYRYNWSSGGWSTLASAPQTANYGDGHWW